ncbi:MAG: LysM peptidoglycan-binding domain-containing protein [Spirochaetaceae bacterium]|jgi:LysM repeat protein|nr:LysM peptidoglycan-binding domain-containing protein [Spirochaetaceae bacterium]
MSTSIGIKLADGSFYPVVKEGKAAHVTMELTTATDNQESVRIVLYRSEDNTLENADYLETIELGGIAPRPEGEPNLRFDLSLNDDNTLQAGITDPETGNTQEVQIPLDSPREPPQDLPDGQNTGIRIGGEDFLSTELDDFLNDTPLEETTEFPQADASTDETIKARYLPPEDEIPEELPAPEDFSLGAQPSEDLPPEKPKKSGSSDFTEKEHAALFTNLYKSGDIPPHRPAPPAKAKKSPSILPAIICLVCAAVCVILFLLFLLVIPSPINVRTGDRRPGTVKTAETPAPAAPEPPPQSREPVEVDQIIFTDKPITIVPVPPPAGEAETPPPTEPETPIARAEEPPPKAAAPPPPPLKPEPLRYKIKWGDTLWDIAKAYYRNPWRYSYIARYNGIKNPNRIISGTYILLPPL